MTEKSGLVYSPHPLLAQAGRQVYMAEALPDETVLEYLVRLGIPALTQPMVLHIDGARLPAAMWACTRAKPGTLITVRAVVGKGSGGKNPIATVLTIALIVYAPGIAGAIFGAATWGTAAVLVGGSFLINNVFAPHPPKPQLSNASGRGLAESPTYSLSGGSNRARPFEQMPLVFGQHRMFPDYGSKTFTEFEGDEQYLYQIFNFGLSDLVLSDYRIGNTPIGDFAGVHVEESGSNGALTLFPGNVDTVAGGALTAAASWIQRTTSVNATGIAVEVAGDLFYVNDDGSNAARTAIVQIQYRAVGAGGWTDLQYASDAAPAFTSPFGTSGWFKGITAMLQQLWDQQYGGLGAGEVRIVNDSRKPVRRTYFWKVDSGQYDVRIRRVTADETDPKAISNLTFTQLRTYQPDTADYTGQKRVALKIKASGQLNGVVEQFSALASARCPVFGGGYALQFNGSTNYVQATVGSPQTSSVGSAECWVKFASLPGGEVVPFGDYTGAAGAAGGWLWAIEPDGSWNTRGNGIWNVTAPAGTIVAGQLAHLAMTVNSAGQVTLYKNGIQVATAGNTFQFRHQNYVFGRASHAAVLWANCMLDGARVYTRELSATEVLEHYNGHYRDETGLKGDWEFDEGSGTVAKDSSGSGNHGTLVNSPAWVAGDANAWRVGETSNPAWWVLHFARGKKLGGKRAYGANLPEARIDLANIKAFSTWCTSKTLTFNAVLDRPMNCADMLNTIARLGRGQCSWATGKMGVVWDAENQAAVAVFGMPNIIAGSFGVDYVSEKLSDEIVVSFVNPLLNWEQDTVRAPVPGVVSPESPTTVELFGCTNKDQAGREANLIAANQKYRRRRIRWETDMEGLVVNRGDVVILSHDLTQWEVSGRIVSAADTTHVVLDQNITFTPATQHNIMVRLPDGTFAYYPVSNPGGTTNALTLTAPSPLPEVPGSDPNYPAHDYLYFFGAKPTPGKKVKITDVEPLSETRVRIAAFDEDPSYYLAESNTYNYLTPSATAAPYPVLSGLTIAEQLVPVGNSWAVRLVLTWATTGPYDHAVVRAAYGSDAMQVKGATFDRRFDFIVPDSGTIQLEITGYDKDNNWSTGSRLISTYTILGKAAPPSNVTGFTATVTPTQIELVWNEIPDVDRDLYEVWRGAGFRSGALVYLGKAHSCVDAPKTPGTYNYYIKSFDTSGNPAIAATLASAVINAIGAPTVNAAVTDTDAVLSWSTPSMQFQLNTYEVRYGASFAAGVSLGTTKANTFKTPVAWTGSRTFWVAATDVAGQVGTAGSVAVSVSVPSAPTVSASISGENYILSWTAPSASLPVAEYEIRYGVDFATGTSVTRIKGTTHTGKVTWSGSRSFWIAAYDANNNVGAAGSTAINITVPIAPTISQQVVDNNVLLKWTDAKQTLPIDRYEIRRGAVFSSAIVIGSVSAVFAVIFEDTGGAYKYWVVGIDSAGNYGTEQSVTATVNQPPDYVLYTNKDSQLDSTTRSNWLRQRGDNYALSLNGSTQYGSVASVPDLDSGITGLTFEAWVMLESSMTQTAGLIEKTVGGNVNTSALLFIDGSGAQMRVVIGGVLKDAIASLSGYNLKQPLHVVGRWDGTNVKVAIQGANVGSTAAAGTLDQGAGALKVGQLGVGATGYSLNGKLGPCRIYKRAINDTELAEHYRGIFKTETNIVAAWDHDEGSGAVSNDDTDNAYDLALAAAPAWVKSTLDGRWDATLGAPKAYFPHNVNQTAAEYGTDNGWTTPNAAIAAGSTGPLAPAPTTAQYVEVIDYGSVLAATKIIATLTSSAVMGTVTVTPKISVKKLIGDAWTDYAGVWSVFATQFRYVKVTLDISAAGGNHVAAASQVNFRLDVKLMNDSGMVAAVAGDAGGTQVNFTVSFTDVTSIDVSAQSTTPVIATYDFVDAPNPVGFKVLLFDRATGARVSGTASWSAKGV